MSTAVDQFVESFAKHCEKRAIFSTELQKIIAQTDRLAK